MGKRSFWILTVCLFLFATFSLWKGFDVLAGVVIGYLPKLWSDLKE